MIASFHPIVGIIGSTCLSFFFLGGQPLIVETRNLVGLFSRVSSSKLVVEFWANIWAERPEMIAPNRQDYRLNSSFLFF